MAFPDAEKNLAALARKAVEEQDKAKQPRLRLEARLYAEELDQARENDTELQAVFRSKKPTEVLNDLFRIIESQKTQGDRHGVMESWSQKVDRQEIDEAEYRRLEFITFRRELLQQQQYMHHTNTKANDAIQAGLVKVTNWLTARGLKGDKSPLPQAEVERLVDTMVRHGEIEDKVPIAGHKPVDIGMKVRDIVGKAYADARAQMPGRGR